MNNNELLISQVPSPPPKSTLAIRWKRNDELYQIHGTHKKPPVLPKRNCGPIQRHITVHKHLRLQMKLDSTCRIMIMDSGCPDRTVMTTDDIVGLEKNCTEKHGWTNSREITFYVTVKKGHVRVSASAGLLLIHRT